MCAPNSLQPRQALWRGQVKAYLADRNADPKPYTWKAEGAEILAKIKRARAALDTVQAVM